MELKPGVYQVKRLKAPNNTYHIHIEHEICTVFEKTMFDPKTNQLRPDFNETRLKKVFGKNYDTAADKIKDYNYEITPPRRRMAGRNGRL